MKKGYVYKWVVLLISVLPVGFLHATGTVWSEVKDNVAYVHHDDAYFNCCPEFVTWPEHDSSDYHIINIYEQDTLYGCKCLCYYDFEHVFTGLGPGTYTARVWESPYGDFTLAGTTDFVIPIQAGSLSTTSSVSECSQESGVIESPVSEGSGFATVSVTAIEIRYTLTASSKVMIAVFDAAGRKIRTFDEGFMKKGEHSVAWNCRDDENVPLPRGIYFVRLSTGGGGAAKSLPLIVLK